MSTTARRRYTAREWALGAGTVILVLIILGVASQTGYFNAGYYSPSYCAPNGSGGCTRYIPSLYAPPSYSAPTTGGVGVLAIILAFVAYYYGKSEGRFEAGARQLPDSAPPGAPRQR